MLYECEKCNMYKYILAGRERVNSKIEVAIGKELSIDIFGGSHKKFEEFLRADKIQCTNLIWAIFSILFLEIARFVNIFFYPSELFIIYHIKRKRLSNRTH